MGHRRAYTAFPHMQLTDDWCLRSNDGVEQRCQCQVEDQRTAGGGGPPASLRQRSLAGTHLEERRRGGLGPKNLCTKSGPTRFSQGQRVLIAGTLHSECMHRSAVCVHRRDVCMQERCYVMFRGDTVASASHERTQKDRVLP